MSNLIGMLDASKTSADLVREYALDHYIPVSYTHLTLPTNA